MESSAETLEPPCTGDTPEGVILRHSNMVYRLATSQMKTKFDADDVYQEVFTRYIRKNPCFQSQEHEKAWFIRVTINCCKTAWSSAWRRRTAPLDETMPYLQRQPQSLIDELQKLPQKYRTVVHLHYYEDMSVEKISKAIGKSRSAVKMRLSRAREMLRGILEEDDYV